MKIRRVRGFGEIRKNLEEFERIQKKRNNLKEFERIWKNSKEFERIRKNLKEFSGCLIIIVSVSEFFSLFLLQIFTVNSFEISFCGFLGLVGALSGLYYHSGR